MATHTPSVEQPQQRRSSRQPFSGGSQKINPPPAGEVQKKLPSQHGAQPFVSAGKSKSKGTGTAETSTDPQAEGSKQVVAAVHKGKKTAGSKWEPAELDLPFSPSAKGQKAASGKGKVKGPSPHSVSNGKVKGAAPGVKKQARATAQSHTQSGKPRPDTKEEPASSTPQWDLTAQAEQLRTDVLDSSLGLGKGKRKRTAPKPVHMEEEEEDSKAEEEPGSSTHNHSRARELEEAHTQRCAHHIDAVTARTQMLVVPAD